MKQLIVPEHAFPGVFHLYGVGDGRLVFLRREASDFLHVEQSQQLFSLSKSSQKLKPMSQHKNFRQIVPGGDQEDVDITPRGSSSGFRQSRLSLFKWPMVCSIATRRLNFALTRA
jgi:hypothetical protein